MPSTIDDDFMSIDFAPNQNFQWLSHELHLAQRQQGASDDRLITASRFDVVPKQSMSWQPHQSWRSSLSFPGQPDPKSGGVRCGPRGGGTRRAQHQRCGTRTMSSFRRTVARSKAPRSQEADTCDRGIVAVVLNTKQNAMHDGFMSTNCSLLKGQPDPKSGGKVLVTEGSA